MNLIFKRGKAYLSYKYTWCSIPHAFPTWQALALAELFRLWKDAPTHWARVGQSVDLDAVEWLPWASPLDTGGE